MATRAGLILLILCLCACFGRAAETTVRAGQVTLKNYTVRPGDTLYSIAWQADVDHRSLAEWNSIRPPYTIYPGQTLKFAPTPVPASGNNYVVRRGDTLYGVAEKTGTTVDDLIAWNRLPRPYALYPGMHLRVHGAEQSKAQQKKFPTETRAKPPVSRKKIVWVWPARGSIINRFDDKTTSKGIDIADKLGAKIFAASAGKVVYQGNGLPGYGQLVIIKHDDEFLSAYAHCQRVSVKEGDVLKTGQEIAQMGNTGADRVKLHFELRYQGRPVDPLDYLPKQ